jgi:signal transduction histidine kinase
MRETPLDEHRLRRLLEVGRSLVSELDLETVLNQVLDVARELTGATYAALGILDVRRRDELERFIVSGIDEETHRAIGDLPRGRGLLGELIRKPEALRLEDLSLHPHSYGFPPDHPPMTTFLGVPILIRGEAYGNIYLTEKDAGPFTEADEEALVVLAEWAAIAIGNARLYAGLDERRKDLERAVKGLEATTTIAKAVGGETDLARVLELITKRARALVEARRVLIFLEEDGNLVVAASAGKAYALAEGLQIPIKDTLPGDVLNARQPVRIADVHSTVRLAMGELAAAAQTALLVPLVFRGRSSGLLVAFDRLNDDPQFDAEDERLLSAFAASAATAVATAQTVADERLRESIRAAEEERVRWARELHDETLQGLGALQVMLTAGLRNTDDFKSVANQAVAHIEEEITKLQTLITELRPAALDELGLGPAVTALMKRAQVTHPFEVELELNLDYESGRAQTRLDPEIASTLYRLVQEAMTNAGKHADAQHVEVSIVQSDGTVVASVSDDGKGFNPDNVGSGFGLVGMRERLSLVGGNLDLTSAPGAGTTVTARVPVGPA